MFFLIILFGFGVVCYGIAGLPMMFDKGTGYFIYALFLEALLIALLVVCIKKYRSPKYQEKLEVLKSKPAYKALSIIACVCAIVFALGVCLPKTDIENPPGLGESEKIEGWRGNLSPELVAEIESAFAEIGENPDNIINVEYVDTHTSGYVFEQKCYKVEFDWSFGNPGYKHSRYYRIVTQNYYEGEPEKEQYPNEFLCTIKYWAGDDGHGTNINQWSYTGNGKMQ